MADDDSIQFHSSLAMLLPAMVHLASFRLALILSIFSRSDAFGGKVGRKWKSMCCQSKGLQPDDFVLRKRETAKPRQQLALDHILDMERRHSSSRTKSCSSTPLTMARLILMSPEACLRINEKHARCISKKDTNHPLLPQFQSFLPA